MPLTDPLGIAIQNQGPALYLRLDESAGPTAIDSSSGGHNGTYTGVSQFNVPGVPGGNDGAISFWPQPAVPPHHTVSLTGNVDFTALTVVTFLRIFVNTFANSEVPASASNTNAFGWALQFSSADNLLHWLCGSLLGYQDMPMPSTAGYYNDGNWHMIALTRNVGTLAMNGYVDGAFVASKIMTAAPGVFAPNGLLGCLNSTPNVQPYTAWEGHFATFSRILTVADLSSIFTAAGAPIASIGNILTEVTAGVYPLGYTLGTANVGLSGAGTIAVPHCVGALVTLTTVPSRWGKSDDIPTHYVPAVGRIQFSTLDGDDGGQLVHTPTQLIWADNRLSLFLRYFFRAGVTASITPIVSAQ